MSRRAWALILGAGALGTVACGPNLAPLRTQASADLSCADSSLSTQDIAFGVVHKVEGCGKENVYVFDRTKETWTSALDRASFEFSCKKSELSTKHLGGPMVGVTGCGHKAVYVLKNDAWLLNSESENKPTR